MEITLPVPVLPKASRELTPREQARQAAETAKLQTARDVIKSMASSRKDSRAEANAAARQKVEMLKQRMKMLQMSGIGNPKGLAKQIAALAKELAAAVKSYVASGGSASDAGTASSTPAPETSEAKEDAPASAPEAAPKAAEAKTEDGKPKNPYDKAINALNEQAAKAQKASGEKQEDDAFANDVKQLAKALKAMLAKAKQAVKDHDPEADDADKAVAALEKELADLESQTEAGVLTTGAGASVSVTA